MDLETLRRNSKIHILADGTILHDGDPIENPRIIALFRRGLRVRDDGEIVLHVGSQWCYVTADDVALFVESVIPDVLAGRLTVRLWNDEIDYVAPDSLKLNSSGHLYGQLAGRSVRVRFFRTAYHQLAQWWQDDPLRPGKYVLQLGENRWPLESCDGDTSEV